MRRRRTICVYGVFVGVFLSSLSWYVTTPEQLRHPYGITEDDGHGVESIYPGDKSYGVQKHVIYPTKKPSQTSTRTDVLTNTAATTGLVLKLVNKNVGGTYARENVENVDGKATGLPKKQGHAPFIVDRSLTAANQRDYDVQKTRQEERRTDNSVSIQPTDQVRQLAVLSPANITSHVVEYPTRPPKSRIKQFHKHTTRTRQDLARPSKQSNKEHEMVIKITSQVHETINLNADNSRKFANILLPVKRRSNASETSKKLEKYPTRPPQSRIKQYSQRTTQTREDLLRTSKQPKTESEVEVKRTVLVYEKINLNADNSRKFAKILLPLQRPSNSSDTSKKLVEYPTRIPRKDVDAMFRLQARNEADNRARKRETREERTTTTLRAPGMLPGVRATGRRIRPVAGGTAPALGGENVVSMSVYGSAPRYMAGVMRNAELVRENFPGWKLRVYTEVPSDRPRYGVVPQTVLERLRALGTDVYFMDPREETVPPMMWRFLVADDMSVDRFIIRDADSRLTERDAAAVRAWIASGKPFNCIRDHPSHAQYAVSGGMWGGKPAQLKYILRKSWRELMKGSGKAYLQDMMFLIQVIWPKVEAHAYCSDSVSCEEWPNAHPFPVPRYGYDTVGQVVNEHEMGRIGDIQILRRAGENRKCSPKIADLI